MRAQYILISFLLTFALSRCTTATIENDVPVKARVPVHVTGISIGNISNELTFSASTLYLKRNVVTSPIPAFIAEVFTKLGDPVKRGQLLYVLETKERRALGANASLSDSTMGTYGAIKVKAPATGIVSTLDKQQVGDYVLEGSQLCTIAESNALAFAVNIPFEYKNFTRSGTPCTLLMPDNTSHRAKFTTPLTTMNSLAQTQTILAKSDEPLFLPENLIVRVMVKQNAGIAKQIFPKAAILSDEMMEKFWVMKLINDSTAVKIDIDPGVSNKEVIEVKSPIFNTEDQFLISGNYGLPDTALVKVIH